MSPLSGLKPYLLGYKGAPHEVTISARLEMMQTTALAAADLPAAPMIADAIPLIDVAGHLAGDAEASRKAAAQLRWAFETSAFIAFVTSRARWRYAIPFFCDPDHDTIIECLPSCRSAGNPPKYPPIRFGDYALWFARKSYEHMANEPAPPATAVTPGARATAHW